MKENIKAQLIVPLKSKGRVMGTLCAATRRPREFTGDEIGLLNAIGNAIGVAVENAGLYQKEREISGQLRQSEENYRGLFENATEAIFVYDLQGRIISGQPGLREAQRLRPCGDGGHGYRDCFCREKSGIRWAR